MSRLAHRFLPALALALGLAPLPAEAASLRRATVVHHAQVRLSDLFSDLDQGQDCDIGPAPLPGQSLVIGGAQLSAIATQFGVDWPDASDRVQTVLTRASRTIAQDDIQPLILAALRDRGLSDSATLDLGNFSGPAVAAEGNLSPTLTNLVYDAAHGRFSAFFSIASGTGAPLSFRADGTVSSPVQVVVTTHDLAAGQIVAADDLESIRKDSRSLPMLTLHDPEQAVGQATRRAIAAHTPLTRDMLNRMDLVEKGAPVVLDVSSTGLHLTASGVALDTGGRGERIHVLNPASRMIVVGEIIDRNRVEVAPGSTPMPAGQSDLRLANVRAQRNI